jgi:hypothetical protein
MYNLEQMQMETSVVMNPGQTGVNKYIFGKIFNHPLVAFLLFPNAGELKLFYEN